MNMVEKQRLQERLATALWKEGLELQLAGELPQAQELYRNSLSMWETAEAHTFLGWTLSFEGRLQDAIDHCERAIEADPSLGNPYNDIGAYLVELGREGEAMEWFEQAKMALRYENPQFPYLNLARIFIARGEYGDALIELHAARLLAPGDERIGQYTARIRSRLH